MVNIKQSRMQMARDLERMKTFHQFEYSNYFWRERTKEIVLKVENVGEIFFFTHKESEKVVGD